MMAGALKEVIEVYEPQKQINEFGERVITYVKIYTTRAEVVHSGGNRANENGEIVLTQSRIFRTRNYVPISDYCRIKWNGEFYRITNLEEDKRLQMLTIVTEKVNE